MQFTLSSSVPNFPALAGSIPSVGIPDVAGETAGTDFSALLAGAAGTTGALPSSANAADPSALEAAAPSQTNMAEAAAVQSTAINPIATPLVATPLQSGGLNPGPFADGPSPELATATPTKAPALCDGLLRRMTGRAGAVSAASATASSDGSDADQALGAILDSKSRKAAPTNSDDAAGVVAVLLAPLPEPTTGGPLAPGDGDLAASGLGGSESDAATALGSAPSTGVPSHGRSGGKALAMAARAMLASDVTSTTARTAAESVTNGPELVNERLGSSQGSAPLGRTDITTQLKGGQGGIACTFDAHTPPSRAANVVDAESKPVEPLIEPNTRIAPTPSSASADRPVASAVQPLSVQVAGAVDGLAQRSTPNLPSSPSLVGADSASAAAFDQTRTPGVPAAVAPVAAENIAAESAGTASITSGRRVAAFKYQLASQQKELTPQGPRIGIDGAKDAATMPAGSILDRSTDPVAPLAPAVAEVRSEPTLPQSVALPSTAHRAVEAVLDVTERFAARDQHSVNLQFSVGGSDLSVRVELRGNEVHTTFRTDSADLRSALASEWQSVTQSSAEERSVRLATPVFTANANGNSNTGFSQEDPRRQPAPDREQPATWSTFTHDAGNRAAEKTASQVAVPSRTAALNSRHLHTLA